MSQIITVFLLHEFLYSHQQGADSRKYHVGFFDPGKGYSATSKKSITMILAIRATRRLWVRITSKLSQASLATDSSAVNVSGEPTGYIGKIPQEIFLVNKLGESVA